MSDDIVIPLVNLNGTSREALVQQQIKVLGCLTALSVALGEASPHGRDYQPDPSRFPEAVNQHAARVRDVNRMIDEVYHIATTLRTEGRKGLRK